MEPESCKWRGPRDRLKTRVPDLSNKNLTFVTKFSSTQCILDQTRCEIVRVRGVNASQHDFPSFRVPIIRRASSRPASQDHKEHRVQQQLDLLWPLASRLRISVDDPNAQPACDRPNNRNPVLYMADGTEYDLPPIQILAGGVATVNVNDALTNIPPSLAAHGSQFGSAAIQFTGIPSPPSELKPSLVT